jgi:hypothetical protein
MVTASSLLSAFQRRLHEIVDFNIRCYEPLALKSFAAPLTPSDGAPASPTSDSSSSSSIGNSPVELSARLDAITVGSIWLEAFSRVNPYDRTVGTGRTKFTPDALTVVSGQELEERGPQSSMVTEELHDDPEGLFRNDRVADRRVARGEVRRADGNGDQDLDNDDVGGDDDDIAEPLLSRLPLRRKIE